MKRDASWLLLALAGGFFLMTGWMSAVFEGIPVLPGLIVGSLVAGRAAFRYRRRRALFGFPLLTGLAGLLIVSPVGVSIQPISERGVRVVPILYGLPTPGALEEARRGEIVLGGCMVYPGRKQAVVRIGFGLGTLVPGLTPAADGRGSAGANDDLRRVSDGAV